MPPTPTQPNDFIPPLLKKVAPYFLLALAVFAAYGNVYDNAFLYDDESLILKNAFLGDWNSIGAIFSTSITAGANIPGGFYRPLQILLYLIIYQFAGPSTLAFHVLNVALHAANACLVYLLGRKMRFRATGCFFAALLWALHPVHTEIIAYMSGVADPLFAFFCLLGVIVLLPYFRPRRFIFAIPLFILALLSKEEAIVFPLLVMTCIFFLDKNRFQPKTYLRTWPLWLIAAIYFIWHQFFSGFADFDLHHEHDLYADDVLCRIYTALATLPSYLRMLAWPVGLHFDRNFPAVETPWHLPVLDGLVIVALASLHIFLGRSRRALALSWGLLWFAAAHLLHTGILIPVNASLLEHWLYLPSVGLFLGVAQSFASARSLRWVRRQRAESMLAIIAAFVLGTMTYQQNTVWADPVSFYLNVFKNGEPSPHAHNNLGVEYTLRGEYQKALEQYELSIELSGDTNAQAHHDLAITLLNGPNGEQYTQEAIKHFKRALEIDPDYYPAAAALVAMYEKAGDKENAGLYRQKAEEAQSKMRGQAP